MHVRTVRLGACLRARVYVYMYAFIGIIHKAEVEWIHVKNLC